MQRERAVIYFNRFVWRHQNLQSQATTIVQALDGNDSTSSIRELFFYSSQVPASRRNGSRLFTFCAMPKADVEPDAQSYEHVAAACEERLAPWAALRLLYGVLPRRLKSTFGSFFQDQ